MLRRTLLGAAAALTLAAGLGGAQAQDEPRMGVVVKIGGIPWFNAMERGIEERGEELGIDAFMIGPTSADPALQVRAIEDLIAQGVDVIGVVPNDAEVLEPVLAKAREAGITVITHESPGQQNVDYNFELASADGFGEAHAELLAQKMGGTGQYAVFVGSLTVPLHNAWADAAIAYLEENHPDMELVGERYGVAESVDDSRSTALDLMSANPELTGFLAFGSQGPDRRRARRGGAAARRRGVRARPVLARPGPLADKGRRGVGRVHVEPDGGGPGVRDDGRPTRERRRPDRARRDDRGPGRGHPRGLQHRGRPARDDRQVERWTSSPIWASEDGRGARRPAPVTAARDDGAVGSGAGRGTDGVGSDPAGAPLGGRRAVVDAGAGLDAEGTGSRVRGAARGPRRARGRRGRRRARIDRRRRIGGRGERGGARRGRGCGAGRDAGARAVGGLQDLRRGAGAGGRVV